MKDLSFQSLSPLDGRYFLKTQNLRAFFSEEALNYYRVAVEIQYLLFLSHKKIIPSFSPTEKKQLIGLIEVFNWKENEKIKAYEKKTHHDVKAVELYLQSKLKGSLHRFIPYIHIGLTSEDTNSISYGLALRNAKNDVLLPMIEKVITSLCIKAKEEKNTVMLARTHGQPAVPTTLGKEFFVFAKRLYIEYQRIKGLNIEAKLNGAVGNYNAHVAAFPKISWMKVSRDFLLHLGLQPNEVTTQIVPGDSYVRIFQCFMLINSILIGCNQDIWRYISDDYLILRKKKEHVGSSTMPHKVNPIDFENSEGNLGLANSLFGFFCEKLPVSRLQRDLSDSTVKRNMGVAFGHCLLGYESFLTGLEKVMVHKGKMNRDLESHWEVIAEGIQTILRTEGEEDAYDLLKSVTYGKTCSQEEMQQIILKLPISAKTRERLVRLTPFTYSGLASKIVTEGVKQISFKN